jgi:hypothetical protein
LIDDLGDDRLLRLLGREPRDPLECGTVLPRGVLELLPDRPKLRVAIGDLLRATLDILELAVEALLASEEP